MTTITGLKMERVNIPKTSATFYRNIIFIFLAATT
jgi:hypothetical protein